MVIALNISHQEREAEKIAEEAAALRDVKTELPPARSPETWHGSAYYRHLNVLKGEPRKLAFGTWVRNPFVERELRNWPPRS